MARPTYVATTLSGGECVRVLQGGRYVFVTLDQLADLVLARQALRDAAQDQALAAETAARAGADTGQAVRLAGLEARPEEVAHFTVTARLPDLAVATNRVVELTNLVPAIPGDVLPAGAAIYVAPAAPLPAGVALISATVPRTGVLALQLSASVAVATGALITWGVSALR